MATFRDKLPEKEAEVVAKLKAETGAIFFFKVMKPSMVDEDVEAPFAYQLEFPKHFLRELRQRYRMELPGSVVLQMFDTEKQWRLEITRTKRPSDYEERVRFGAASGWKEFVVENHLKVGDFLLFLLTDQVRFTVYKKGLSDYAQTPLQWRPRQ